MPANTPTLSDLVAACRVADEAAEARWVELDALGFSAASDSLLLIAARYRQMAALTASDAARRRLGKEWSLIAALIASAQDDTDLTELDKITAYAKALVPTCHSVYEVLDLARPVAQARVAALGESSNGGNSIENQAREPAPNEPSQTITMGSGARCEYCGGRILFRESHICMPLMALVPAPDSIDLYQRGTVTTNATIEPLLCCRCGGPIHLRDPHICPPPADAGSNRFYRQVPGSEDAR